MNILKNKKFKYGSLSVALTALVICLIIVFNAGFTALANHFAWYVDMTREQIYDISETSKNLLKNPETDAKVKIIFLASPDMLESSQYAYEVYKLSKKYEAEFDFVSVEHIDYVTNPDKIQDFLKHGANVTLDHTNVIFAQYTTDENGNEQIGLYKIRTMQSFFVSDAQSATNKPFAFNGEYVMTTSIFSLTVAEHPNAYFTTQHGEKVPSQANDGAKNFKELIESVGYEVSEIDLSKEDPDYSKTPCLIIINGPLYDFSKEEIMKLTQLYESGNAHIIAFVEQNKKLPMLFEMIENYGVLVQNDLVIEEDLNYSLTPDGVKVIATYAPTKIALPSGEVTNIGAQLHDSVRKISPLPKTITNNTRSLLIDHMIAAKNSTNVYPVLTTSPTAVLRGENGEEKKANSAVILALSERAKNVSSTLYKYNYLLVSGTVEFAQDEYLEGSYANRDILYTALRSMSRGDQIKEAESIRYKDLDTQELDITAAQANTWMIVLSFVIPAGVFACGMVVFIRRRHL